MYHHRKRRDSNSKPLKALAERIGASWLDLSQLGDDAPDALVGFQGTDTLIEIKVEGAYPEPGQVLYARAWRGRPVVLIRTGNDLMGLLLGPAYGQPVKVIDVQIPEKKPKGGRRGAKKAGLAVAAVPQREAGPGSRIEQPGYLPLDQPNGGPTNLPTWRKWRASEGRRSPDGDVPNRDREQADASPSGGGESV